MHRHALIGLAVVATALVTSSVLGCSHHHRRATLTTDGSDANGRFAVLTIGAGGPSPVSLVLRLVQPGSFTMGSPPTEAGREPQYPNSETQHQVEITQPYWLGQTKVTQRFWLAVMGSNPSFFHDDEDRPIDSITWNDADAFIHQLNTMLPTVHARLPTEAEWEYAARAGTTGPFSIAPVNATTIDCWADAGDPYVTPPIVWGAPVVVGSLPPNPWGFFEMHGSAWEWCSDWWQNDLGASPAIDPTGPSSGTGKVFRGGSWGDYGRYCRSAARRTGAPATYTSGGNSMRLVLEYQPSQPYGPG